MGYKIPRRTATLVFHGSDYEGAEVKVRLDIDLGTLFDIAGRAETQDPKETREVIKDFADQALEAWNLEDDEGNALPATVEGMERVPLPLAQLIIQEWVKAVSQPPDPLSGPSANGSTWEEPQIVPARSSRNRGGSPSTDY